jgi:hypothetical protein
MLRGFNFLNELTDSVDDLLKISFFTMGEKIFFELP